jgi:hypothetical protein
VAGDECKKNVLRNNMVSARTTFSRYIIFCDLLATICRTITLSNMTFDIQNDSCPCIANTYTFAIGNLSLSSKVFQDSIYYGLTQDYRLKTQRDPFVSTLGLTTHSFIHHNNVRHYYFLANSCQEMHDATRRVIVSFSTTSDC